jgi:hypothetical protein
MHSSVWMSGGHGLPLLQAAWITDLVRVDVPCPHVVEQGPNPKFGGVDHSDVTVQSTVRPAPHSSA